MKKVVVCAVLLALVAITAGCGFSSDSSSSEKHASNQKHVTDGVPKYGERFVPRGWDFCGYEYGRNVLCGPVLISTLPKKRGRLVIATHRAATSLEVVPTLKGRASPYSYRSYERHPHLEAKPYAVAIRKGLSNLEPVKLWKVRIPSGYTVWGARLFSDIPAPWVVWEGDGRKCNYDHVTEHMNYRHIVPGPPERNVQAICPDSDS